MAGAYTHTETVAYANNSGQIQSLKNVMTGDAEFNVSTLVAANTAAQEIDVAFARAQLRSLCITSTGPVTIMTNSSTTPGDTKTLIAGQTLIWDTKHPEALPFTDTRRMPRAKARVRAVSQPSACFGKRERSKRFHSCGKSYGSCSRAIPSTIMVAVQLCAQNYCDFWQSYAVFYLSRQQSVGNIKKL